MKIYLLFIALLLVACSKAPESNMNNVTLNMNLTKNITPVVTSTVQEEKVEVDNNQEENLFETNFTLYKDVVARRSVKGTIHTIEVIDVTDNEDGCLIKVDDSTTLIDKGETRTINEVRIFVSDVRVFRNRLEDKDICELIIA